MNEREFNTDDFGEDTSLSGQISRRRQRGRRMNDGDTNSIAGGSEDSAADEHFSDAGEGRAASGSEKRMRITMLGISGSGKTSFLSGVYQTMIMGSFHGISLAPSSNVDKAFQQIGQIADIALINRENFDFGDGTAETTIFPLTLENGGETVCDFDFTDYAGGDVLNILNPHGEMTTGAKALRGQLLGSDAILIFADAYLLSSGRNIAEWQRSTGATTINPIFNTLVRNMGDKPMTVLFVLTKTDDERIPNGMKANNCAILTERMLQAFQMIAELVQRKQGDGWSFGVVPVSAVGEGNYELRTVRGMNGQEIQRPVVKEGKSPKPYNIDVTMVYTIACILSQWKRAVDEEKQELEEKMISVSRGNTFLGNIFSDLKKKKRPEEKVAALLEEIEEREQKITGLTHNIHDLLDQTAARTKIQRRRDHLTDGGQKYES